MMEPYVIGFDVGGTRLKHGAVTRTGTVFETGIQPSGFHLAPERLVEAVETEVARVKAATGTPPAGVALGFPGAVDPEYGVVLLPGKIKGLEGFPVVPRLRRTLGCPVVADNDGRLSIYAERHYGQAQNLRWAVTVTLGTGVGSGVMLDGHILRDPHLQFGTQLSHTIQQADGGRLCLTGARGTAEMRCSATALAMALRDALQRGIPSLLSDRYFADPKAIDFEAVIEGVRAQDPLCLDEFDRWKTNLGWLLVTAVHAYAPECIILSGGATHAADLFLEDVAAHMNRHLFRYPPGEPVPVVVSELRDHAGVLGAAALAWTNLDAST